MVLILGEESYGNTVVKAIKDHQRREVRVSTGHGGHHRSVCHQQVVETHDATVGCDDRLSCLAHPTGAGGVLRIARDGETQFIQIRVRK